MADFSMINDMVMVYFRDIDDRNDAAMDEVIRKIAHFCDYDISITEIENIKDSVRNMA